MNPFKIFLFFLVLLIFVSVFRERESPLMRIYLDEEELRDNMIIPADSSVCKALVEVEQIDSVQTGTFLELPGSDSCLYSFFKGLNRASDTLVRIIYYGDSQIEGDHLTYTLRSRLQNRFGGKGIGYMPMEMYFNTTEKLAIVTKDFEKHIVAYDQKDTLNDFGLYGRYFQPNKNNAEVRIVNRKKEILYSNVKLLYTGQASLVVEGATTKLYNLNTLALTQKTIDTNETSTNLKLNFSDINEFTVYGFLLDSDKGIAVDDVSFRGNLNLMLNRFDGSVFRQMGELLKPALIILHFGLNVVPDERSSYKSYGLAVERDIRLLKDYLPCASIVVVGVSDMAHKVDGEFKAYSNITLILEEQRKAAINQKVAFWNIRQAMGGEGAIIQWVEKGWARTDYAHLTLDGTRQIGELLNRDLLQAYDQYVNDHE